MLALEFFLKLQRILQLTSLLLLAALNPGVRGQKRSKSLDHSLQPENNPKAQPRSSAVAELFVLSLSLSLLFPIILYSTYCVLQCNKFGRKTKETLTGFYKYSLDILNMIKN